MKISHLILGLLCFVALFFIGHAIATLPIKIILVLIIGLICSILTIMNLEIGLYLLIFVIPFTQQITIAKYGTIPVDIGTDDVLIIFIILSWLANLARRKEPIFLKTSLNWPIIAFFTAAVFSFIGAYRMFGTGPVLIGFLHLFKFFEYVAIYFIVVSAIRNFDQIKKFLLMCFIVVGFVTIIQFGSMIKWGQFSLSIPAPSSYLYMQTMYSFTSNAILGAYYSFFLAILLAIIISTSGSRGKMPLILFGTMLSFALFNTFSRSAYLGIVMGFFVLAMVKEKRLFLLVLLLIVFSPVYMQSAVLERITLTIQSLHPTLRFDPSASVRLSIWKKGLQVFLNNPIFGTGYWTTRWVLRAEAHSQYVAILIDTGIVGFSVFCWLIIRMFRNAIVLIKKANTDFLNALGVGYIAGFAAILTTCFFSDTLEAFRVIGPLWFVTGLITSANRLLSKKTEQTEISKD